MSTKSQEKVNPAIGERDVAALFGRFGLNASHYREFATRGDERRLVRTLRTDTASGDWERRNAVDETAVFSNPGSLALAGSTSEHRNALDSVFDGPTDSAISDRSAPTRVAFFSLAGGTGKTTLAVSLACLLGRRSMQVLLVNYSNDLGLQHYLQPKSPRFGLISFLHAPEGSGGIPVTVIDASANGPAASKGSFGSSVSSFAEGKHESHSALLIQQASQSADIILYDMPVTTDRACRELLRTADHILVPLQPDLQSAASIPVLDSLLALSPGHGPEVKFLINRFEPSRPFHRDLRERVECRLGDRLLPMVIRDEPLVSEAMASRLTVPDYAPSAPITQDFEVLADWLCLLESRSPQAAVSHSQGAVA